MLLSIAARLHFVFVNHTPLCQTAGCRNITKRIKARRLVMTQLAVCFISKQCVLIPPLTTVYSFKADFTPHLLFYRGYMALLAMKWFLVFQLREIVAAAELARLKRALHIAVFNPQILVPTVHTLQLIHQQLCQKLRRAMSHCSLKQAQGQGGWPGTAWAPPKMIASPWSFTRVRWWRLFGLLADGLLSREDKKLCMKWVNNSVNAILILTAPCRSYPIQFWFFYLCILQLFSF